MELHTNAMTSAPRVQAEPKVWHAGWTALQMQVKRLGTLIALWRSRSVARPMLMYMDERDLKDIGITRHDARREWRKPFWQA